MTYQQLLDAIEHARSLVQMIEEIEPVSVDGDQRAYKTDDLAELRRSLAGTFSTRRFRMTKINLNLFIAATLLVVNEP